MKLLPATIRPSVVGHLPRKISRFAHYLIINEGEHRTASLMLTIDNHHWFKVVYENSYMYMSDACCGAAKEQRTSHEKVRVGE